MAVWIDNDFDIAILERFWDVVMKKVTIIILTICALLLGTMYWLRYIYTWKTIEETLGITSFRWFGCYLGCGFAISTLLSVWSWKTTPLLKGFVIFFAIISLLSSVLWLLESLMFIGGIPGMP